MMKEAFPCVSLSINSRFKFLAAICIISLTAIAIIALTEDLIITNYQAHFLGTETAIFRTLDSTIAFSVTVTISGRQILVNSKPFVVKGVGYAPIPIGIDPENNPPFYGDFFIPADSAIYGRDLPLLRHMGANTVRLWGWNNTANHTDFLDHAYNGGVKPIYVIVTFWIGFSVYPDICSQTARTQIKTDFRSMVSAHKNHSAVLMWAIGNELNAPWMYGSDLTCLFSLINEMALEAHLEEGINYRPVTTPLADIDLINTLATYDSTMTNLDVWSANLYRGSSFGTFFDDYAVVSNKPFLILEYGTDAYNDENENEDEETQAAYAASLWGEVVANRNICSGGSIMAYNDEWWKGKYGQERPSCPDPDPAFHSTCGYASNAHPDGYANEEWWGVMRTKDNGANSDTMEPRMVYHTLQSLWADRIYLPIVLKSSS